MKSKAKHSRRAFLTALGVGPGLLPLLPQDFARAGCLAKPPKRLIAVVWSNGTLETHGSSGPDYTLPGSMKGLEPYRGDIIPIKGVRLQTLKDTPNPKKADSAGHGATPALLTGRKYFQLEPFKEIGGGPSIDAFVAAALMKQGISTPRATLNLGVSTDTYLATWRDSNQVVAPDNDPFHAFMTVYGGAAMAADPRAAKLRLARNSVFDRIKGDLAAFKSTIGKEGADRMEAHLTSVRELEKDLAAIPGASGASGSSNGVGCTPPDLGAPVTINRANFDKITKAQMDLAVSALAADVTRAATIQIGTEACNGIIPTWLGFKMTGDTSSGVGDSNGMHSIAHRGGNDKLKVDGWFHDMFGYLIGKLKAEKEGDGTSLLDNTIVLFLNHMQNGGSHSIDNIPVLLAGRCRGYFKTGQGVNVANVSHTAVLREMIRAMGVNPAGFCQPEYEADLPALRA